MSFSLEPVPAALPPSQYDRMVKLLTVHYAFPLPYPLAGAFFEELFAEAVGGVREERKGMRKLLFDVLRGQTGWSLKTLVWPSIEIGDAIEVVVQRCDILRDRTLSLATPANVLGERILNHFNDFCLMSAERQGIPDQRAGFLVRKPGDRDFAFFQHRPRIYSPAELTWQWARDRENSLVGCDGDRTVYRWYRSGTQLFGAYQIPEQSHQFRIDWKRVDLDATIAYFEQAGIAHLDKEA